MRERVRRAGLRDRQHASPCGVAIGDITAATSALTNRPDLALWRISSPQPRADAATATDHQPPVRSDHRAKCHPGSALLLAAKQNVRVLACGQWQQRVAGLDFKRVNGGLLVQDRDLGMVTAADLRVVSERQPTNRNCATLFC